MGDGFKITKDKRHRSSSSIAGVVLEGTRSERKLDYRPSIAEVDDQFTIAEARCEDLQEKIDLVKGIRRKRKLKKRSMTRVTEQPVVENVPFISVRAMPKKKVLQQAARLRLEVPANPTRGYLDPATVEQHRMIGQMQQSAMNHNAMPKTRPRRARADGDAGRRAASAGVSLEVACGEDEPANCADDVRYQYQQHYASTNTKKPVEIRQPMKIVPGNRRRHVPRDLPPKEEEPKLVEDEGEANGTWRTGTLRRRLTPNTRQQNVTPSQQDDRPVVELFNKNRPVLSAHNAGKMDLIAEKHNKRGRNLERQDNQSSGPLEDARSSEFFKEKEVHRHPRRVRYRSRRYEQPTVASQMKQAGVRYYQGASNYTNIPFIVSKSTAPSHNIGVNIQQVLNGLKIQQPLSGIPLTIAHHMGLGHIPHYDNKSTNVTPALDVREMNAIRLGRRLVRLPSYKCMSYSRLLALYREGDGMVPRFLRAISRPHYFYTSMYNLATQREDFDGATSKGRANQEAKQSLAEYASLYREYEQVDKRIREGNYESDLARRKEELTRELAAREEHIRRVVQDCSTGADVEQCTLRASASTAEDGCRYSTFKLNLRDAQQ